MDNLNQPVVEYAYEIGDLFKKIKRLETNKMAGIVYHAEKLSHVSAMVFYIPLSECKSGDDCILINRRRVLAGPTFKAEIDEYKRKVFELYNQRFPACKKTNQCECEDKCACECINPNHSQAI